MGLTPNGLTLLGFAITAVGAALAAIDLWLPAAFIVFIGGVFDMFDGTLARATGKASKFGAFLDSMFDRWGEAIVYVGIVVGCLSADFNLRRRPGGLRDVGRLPGQLRQGPGRERSALHRAGAWPRSVSRRARSGWSILTSASSHPESSAGPQTSDGSELLGLALGLIGILATITVIQRIIHVTKQAAPTDGE